jgi:hypothetical protein
MCLQRGSPDLSGGMARLDGLGAGGLVVLQAHFNNPLVGCMGLARATGRRVWVTISAVTDHPQVHPAVSMHFRRKYAQAQASLNGGGFQETESPVGLRRLYRALKAGDLVVVMADLPAAPGQEGVCVPWLGQHRVMAAGAVRLARQTGCAMAAMVVTCPANGAWQWTLSEPLLPQPGVPDAVDEAVGAAYGALGAAIRGNPGRWWAAHLLQDAPCLRWQSWRHKGTWAMTLDWVVIRAGKPAGCGVMPSLVCARCKRCGRRQTRVLVGMDWTQALALLLPMPKARCWYWTVPGCQWTAVVLNAWTGRCARGPTWRRPAIHRNLNPMQPVAYATLRGMERFVNLHPVAVHPVDATTACARFELGTVAGWRKRQAGTGQVCG